MTFGHQIKKILQLVLKRIDSCKKTFDQQQHIRQGVRIVLLGSVNVGKSSLFNALLKQQRAIVTDIAGTTRDVIESGLYVDGNYWTLVDTAGLHKTDNIIEIEGIKRSFQEARRADIVLLVYDGSRVMTHEERNVYMQLLHSSDSKCIFVCNKSDLPCNSDQILKNQVSLQTSFLNKNSIDT